MSDLQRVGPVFGGTGTAPPFTADISGAQRVQDAHGRYFDSAMRNQMYFATSGGAAGVTTTAALATTHTGLVVSNPVGSNTWLVVNKVSWAWSVIAAAVNNLGLAVGYNAVTNVTHTTPTAVNRTIFSGVNNGGVAFADISSTLPTAPVLYALLANTPAATTNPPGGILDLDGALILPPGAYLCSFSVTASAAAATWWMFQWEELPILT